MEQKMATDWEEIIVNGITFVFKNNPAYVDETEELKSTFKIITPDLEKYLMNKEYIEMRKEQMEISRKSVLVWLIHPIIDNDLERQTIGSISFCEGNQLIIQIHPVSNYKKEKQTFMFIEILIHEIFHLFFDNEMLVREKAKEFVKSNPCLNDLLIRWIGK